MKNLRCEPWFGPGSLEPGPPQPWALVPGHFFIFLFYFILTGVHFFEGLDEVDFFDDESLSSLSRLG
jgi:hypothetical protein